MTTTGSTVRPLLVVAVLAGLAASSGCRQRGVRTENRVALAEVDDFLRFPAKYRNRVVRVGWLEVARVELDRPVVFYGSDDPRAEIVALDGRGLARKHGLKPGDRVMVILHCLEGRTDRGNLLAAVERRLPPAPVSQR